MFSLCFFYTHFKKTASRKKFKIWRDKMYFSRSFKPEKYATLPAKVMIAKRLDYNTVITTPLLLHLITAP